jgi:hypothetical protein
MWARYSSRKWRRVETTGFGAVCPRPHRLVLLSRSERCSRSSRSRRVASPRVILSSSPHICTVPARQGTHLPQDSSRQNSMKYLATSTMQDVSSITMRPPEPMIEPTLASDS